MTSPNQTAVYVVTISMTTVCPLHPFQLEEKKCEYYIPCFEWQVSKKKKKHCIFKREMHLNENSYFKS
jgi:hypothetical protein